jgi:hypothetical protein
MSKFQLQMSGQWNRQVMGNAAAAGLDSAGFDPSQPLGPPAPADSLVSEQMGPAESWDVEDEYGMGSFYMAPQRQQQQQLGQANDTTGDVPSDLSVAPEDFTTAPTSVIPPQLSSSSSSSSSSLSPDGGAAEVVAAAVLADLDKDYAALRGRLVALISQQQQQIQQQLQLQQQQGPAAASTAERVVADAVVADPPPSPPGAAATGKKSYWPPATKRPQTTSGNM